MCWCARFGGTALPRPWSKYTEGSSKFRALHAAEQPIKAPGVRELKKLSKAARAQGATPEEEGRARGGAQECQRFSYYVGAHLCAVGNSPRCMLL